MIGIHVSYDPPSSAVLPAHSPAQCRRTTAKNADWKGRCYQDVSTTRVTTSVLRWAAAIERAARNFRNGDAHFGPRPWPAPYTESGTDPFSLISHPTKTTVQIAPSLKRFRIDSATIVTNDYSQGVVQVLNFNLDLCRFGMT